MTPQEFIQLKAFARIDGALLSVIWIASFASYITGMGNSLLMIVGMILAIGSLFFAAGRTRRFRDTVLNGTISFKRAYAYTILMFFYAAVLFAVAYFQFIDNGYVISRIIEMMNMEENKRMIETYGLTEAMNESLELMAKTRPIDYALNYLTTNIIIGITAALPIAALTHRKRPSEGGKQENNQPEE